MSQTTRNTSFLAEKGPEVGALSANDSFYFRFLHQPSILDILPALNGEVCREAQISVCVVEIDQRKLPNGSSIFILADGKGLAVPAGAVTEPMTAYVNAKTLEQIGGVDGGTENYKDIS